MKKKLTITVAEDVYEGLQAVVGPGNISQFLEDLARPHVVQTSLADGYRIAAEDEVQEQEALEWANSLIGDVSELS